MFGCLQDNQLFCCCGFWSDLPCHFNWSKFLQNHVSQIYFANILWEKHVLHQYLLQQIAFKLFCLLHYGLKECVRVLKLLKHVKKCQHVRKINKNNQWATCWNILLCIVPKLVEKMFMMFLTCLFWFMKYWTLLLKCIKGVDVNLFHWYDFPPWIQGWVLRSIQLS